jgi:protein-L-isoaspartate(D-aspartate) O-methyltransferase
MTELARSGAALGKVLEIGTGCGYQAAVLSRLAKEVYSIERVAGLLAKARKHFREFRVPNVRLRHADGHGGMAEVAPFDAIVMTAAATHVPRELLEQLAVGGKMILPIAQNGEQRGEQRLCTIERSAHGYVEKKMDVVKFVPMLPGVA